jgi:oligopeptide/dipeptide ABC transporter ATP-binding protein
MVVNTRPTGNGTRLEVKHLDVEVHRETGWRQAVRDVSFTVESGERVALVGESGSGKSLTALSIAGLLPQGARIADGEILLDGLDLVTADKKTLRRIRGKTVGFVFQNPMTSLDPLVRVGSQVKEALRAHHIGDRKSQASRSVQMLERTGIHDADDRVHNFPHQFSGGMQQRAMIAGALAADPSLLIADEPTTALDVTVQARVLALLKSLSEERALSLLMITHDLAVASQIAERVIVMYAGRVLEDAPVRTIVERPHHPYTEALLALVPDLRNAVDLPAPIPGNPIPGWDAGPGCPFATRCLHARDECTDTPWSLRSIAPEHLSACIRDQASRDAEVLIR